MAVQTGDIGAYFIYREDDKPKYKRGNKNIVIINIVVIFIFLGTKAYYVYENRKRDRVWNALTKEEQNEYIRNTKIQGSKRLDFRFAH